MRIAFLTDGIYPSLIGGMQKHSYYLVKHLAQHKVQVDLYYFVPENIDDVLLFSEQELKYITPIKLNYPKLFKFPGQYVVSEYLFSKKIYQKLKKRETVDFIYAQGFTSWAFRGHLKTPIGLNLHGFNMFQSSEFSKSNFKMKILQIPAKKSLKKADYVFSFGAKFVDLLANLNIPIEKQIVFFNGISEKWISSDINNKANVKTFLFVGRYEETKGIEILNTVINNLIKKKYKFKFIFAGPIPENRQIKHTKVDYRGYISTEMEMKGIYAEADIYVLPSLSEGMPTVILEAMAFGLAIIATDVGAVRQMVSSENGMLINTNSVSELENAMIKSLNLPNEDLLEMKKNSLELVKQKFTWGKITNSYIKFFNSLKK